MLEEVDKTLEQLISKRFPVNVPSKETQISISFDTPHRDAITNKPAINLFLYDVQENLELRTNEWSVERPSGGDQNNWKGTRKRSPARIDCSYLITAWPQDERDIKTEHQLLGEVMRVLLRYRQIPDEFLPKTLPEQKFALRLVSLRPSKLQNMTEFWQAMGGKEGTKPKVVLHCTVTIAVDLNEDSETVDLVRERVNSVGIIKDD